MLLRLCSVPDGVEHLQSGEVANRPGVQHGDWIVKVVVPEGEVGQILIETRLGQVLNSSPEIPEGDIVLKRKRVQGAVDTAIAFQIIGFGAQNRQHALIDRILQDETHLICEIIEMIDVVGSEQNENVAWLVQAELTGKRCLAGQAQRWIRP